jgi:hypothetical protein
VLPSRRVACTCSFCVTALAGSPLTVWQRDSELLASHACMHVWESLMQCDEVRSTPWGSTLCACMAQLGPVPRWPAKAAFEALPSWLGQTQDPADKTCMALVFFDNHMLFNTCMLFPRQVPIEGSPFLRSKTLCAFKRAI